MKILPFVIGALAIAGVLLTYLQPKPSKELRLRLVGVTEQDETGQWSEVYENSLGDSCYLIHSKGSKELQCNRR